MIRTWSLLMCLLAASLVHAQFLRVYYPDIEQGSATLIVSPTGKSLLIDAGTGLKPTEIGIEDFINDLIDAGVMTKLNYTLATHYDEDHIGRFENVFQFVPMAVDAVAYDRGTEKTPSTFAYRDYAFWAGRHNRTLITPNTTIDLGGGVTVRCFVVNGALPDGSKVSMEGAAQEENARSAAVVVRFGEVDIWIGGDLTDNPDKDHPPVERAVAPFVGDVDVYTVNHHGSRTTSSHPDFLKALKAEVAINQNSCDNSHGHPNFEIVQRIKATPDSKGEPPLFFQTNPSDPDDSRSNDSLTDGIADPDDIRRAVGEPGPITLISDGRGYQIYGGKIAPVAKPADSVNGSVGDFPPAVMSVQYAPAVPRADEPVVVKALVGDEAEPTVTIDLALDGVTQAPIAMTRLDEQTFQGVIPAQPDGVLVSFRVRARDGGGEGFSRKVGYFSGTTTVAQVRRHDARGVLQTKGYSARIRVALSVGSDVFHPLVSKLYVQDGTGGLNVFDGERLPLQVGDVVEFVGKLGQFAGADQLVIAEDFGNYGFTKIESGAAPEPRVVRLSDVGEALEGVLVRVNGVQLTVDSPAIPGRGNGNLIISADGQTRTLRIDQYTDLPGSNTPNARFDVVGIVSQFDNSFPLSSGYQLLPRGKADLLTEEVNHPDVLVGEVYVSANADANGDGRVSTQEDQFIELVNFAAEPREIGGWTLVVDGVDRFTFPAGATLPIRDAAVLFGGGTPQGVFGNAAANGLVFAANGLGMQKTGGEIAIKNAQGEVLQQVRFGPEADGDTSLVRFPDWSNAPLVRHTDVGDGFRFTPGTRTDDVAYTVPRGSLLLSEVLYDPSGADGKLEWLELFNATKRAIALDGLSIGAGGKDYTSILFDLSGQIESGQTFVIGGPDSAAGNGSPRFDWVKDIEPNLQNSGVEADGVALFNVPADLVTKQTRPIDTVVYGVTNVNGLMDANGDVATPDVGDASGGSSIERAEDRTWRITATPTPNQSLMTVTPPQPPGPAMIITEVFYDGTSRDNGWEWIELYNRSTAPVDLSTMSLGSGGPGYTKTRIQLSGTVRPGQTFVVGGPNSSPLNGAPQFDQTLNFSPDLQNSGSRADAVALFDCTADEIRDDRAPVDVVVYGGANSTGFIDANGQVSTVHVADAPAGTSIERTTVAGAWRVRSPPNPNQVALED